MRGPGLIWLLVLAGLLCGAALPVQAADTHWENLRARYLRLRNTDIEISRTEEWRALVGELRDFAVRHSTHSGAPFSWRNAAIMQEQLYRRGGRREDLDGAIGDLARLIERYPRDSLAEDALKRQAELLLLDKGDATATRLLYQRLIREFPQGQYYDWARIKLQELDRGRAADSSAQRAGAAVTEGSGPVIVIDPGHGGEDLGAVGVGGLLEKDVVLAVARELASLLGRDLGARVKLSRETDVFVPLAERTAFANAVQADLFISLHVNASLSHKAAGLEIYYLDSSGDDASRRLAERENASWGGGPAMDDLAFMLSDLIQSGKQEESILLAKTLDHSLLGTLRPRWPTLKSLGVKKDLFYVLVGAHMPAVLVELFFVDHAKEGRLLGQPEFRRALAVGLADGIGEFLDQRPPPAPGALP